LRRPFKSAKVSFEEAKNLICVLIIFAFALYGSMPLFSNSYVPPGYDSVMHYSKVRVFSQLFPSIPQWFPWWYCGTPSLRFYPPLSYLSATLTNGLLGTPPLVGYQLTDFFFFFLAGFFIYFFMKNLTDSHFAGVASAIFYMLSPQTLYGRLYVGQFTHNFSFFLIPLTLFCILKLRDNLKMTVLTVAPLFAFLFLSHLQTALSFGFMLGIYVLFSFFARQWKKGLELPRVKGLVFSGAIGALLSSFWLLPCILEGSSNLGVTKEAALNAMNPVQNLFIESEYLWYKSIFLGYPLIILSLFAIVLIIRGNLDSEKTFWGLTFSAWIALFLFTIVSPYIGIVLSWPSRFAYFIAMPMAMLAGLAVNWVKNYLLRSNGGRGLSMHLLIYGFLVLIVLSVFVHVSNVDQMAWKDPYANELLVGEWFSTQSLSADERVAGFGTFSYPFNIVSDNWQLDGGYIQGVTNMDFYYKYWITLTTDENADAILEILNETNTRYIVFPQDAVVPLFYGNKTFFEQEEVHGFIIYKLKEDYPLSFIEVKSGEALVSYKYLNPDEIQLSVWECSESVTLIIKMNYYPGWGLHSSTSGVSLETNTYGLMKIELHGVKSADLVLQYGSTLIDQIAIGVTIAGAAIYLLIIASLFRISGVCENWRRPR